MKLTSLAAAGLFVALLPSPAFAVEAEAFADAFSGLFEQADFHVSFDSVTMEGNDITLAGVEAAPGDKPTKSFDMTIVFKNVGESDDGGYTADRATIDQIVFKEDEVSFRLDGVVWENVLFYETQPADYMANIYHQSRFFTGPLRVLIDDEPVFRIDRVESATQSDAAAQTVSYDFSANGISLDMTKLPDDADMPPMLDQFGLTELNMELASHLNWNVASGQLQVGDAFIDIGNVGRLAFSFDVLGYDETLVSELYALQQSVETGAGTSVDDQLGAMMRMANQLFLNGVGLRFDDDGITTKLLDFAAAEQGMPRAAMTIGFAAALPIMASELGVPEALQTALLRAATDYMINPRSFEVQLEPHKPVRFSRLAKAIEDEDAETLLGMFDFTVTANHD